MPEPVQGTAVLRKFVTIQSHKKSSGKPCSFQNLSVWLKIFFIFYLFPADPQNRLREDHNAFFQAFDFHELVCSVHTVVDFKVCASKRNTVFQMMHIRSAADRKWFAWFSSDIRVALQQGLDKRAVGRP